MEETKKVTRNSKTSKYPVLNAVIALMSYNKISCIIDIISLKLCQILVFIGLPDA